MRLLKPGTAAKVTWFDATQSTEDGLLAKDVEFGVTCVTIGHVLEHSEKGIKIGFDAHDEQYRMAIGIPAAYIRKVEALT